MKRRAVEILSDDSIGTSGETYNKDLPSDFATTMLAITQEGANVTDEATLAEILAGFGEIEVTNLNGSPVKWDADDLYYFNRDFLGHVPYNANVNSATVDNYIREMTLFIPLNPKGVWDPSFGMTPESKGKVRVVAGSDTNAGMDARTMTITALGLEGVVPESFMGAYLDSFTAVASDNFRSIQADRVKGMFGAFDFVTTGREDLTTTNTPGMTSMGYAVSKSVKEKVRADVLQALISQQAHTKVTVSHAACSATSAAYGSATDISQDASAIKENTDYVLLDLGLHEGKGIQYVDNLQVYIKSGVAEANRLYPLLDIRNR